MTESDDTRLQVILDAMPLMFFHKDTQNRILMANKAAADAVGTSVQEMVGTSTTQWFPDEAGAYFADDLSVMRSGEPKLGIVEQFQVEGEEKHWIRTDKYPHCDADGLVDGILVFIQDATSEARALGALRSSEERLKSIIASEPECVKVVATDGTITEMNPAGLTLLAASSQDDVVGTSMYDWLLPEHHEAFASLHRVVAAGGSGTLEYEIKDLADEHHWIETHAVPLAGTDEGFLSISRNITERRKAEQQREELERQTTRAERLEGIGVLAAGVAHDFNNSLMAIMGNIELAVGHVAEGSPAHRYLTSSTEAAAQAAAMCDQLLTYAGKRTLSLRPADLSRLVSETHDMLSTTIAAQATLRFDLEPALPMVEVDETQIGQILTCLVTNASEALEGRPGDITVSTAVQTFEAADLLRWDDGVALTPGRFVRLRVTDTGRGISADVAERIFEPFFTTKVTGSGLGLPTTLGAIRGHGGAIKVDSIPGEGTTVDVLLPTSDVALGESAPALRSPVQHAAAGVILLVDDDDKVRELLQTVLERGGYTVLAAAGGQAAIERLTNHGEPVVAAVLDITMPGLNGAETYAELDRVQPGIPVVFSSGYPEKVAMDPLIAVEQVEFIHKPYRGADLLDKLAILVDRSSEPTD